MQGARKYNKKKIEDGQYGKNIGITFAKQTYYTFVIDENVVQATFSLTGHLHDGKTRGPGGWMGAKDGFIIEAKPLELEWKTKDGGDWQVIYRSPHDLVGRMDFQADMQNINERGVPYMITPNLCPFPVPEEPASGDEEITA